MAMEALPAEYRHEPALALAGGDDGMDAVRVIVRDAPRFLSPNGVLVVEVGHNRDAAEAAFPACRSPGCRRASVDDGVFLLNRDAMIEAR